MDLSEHVANNAKYVQDVNDNVDMLLYYFSEVKKLLYQPLSDDNYDAAFKLFYKIFHYVPLMMNELPVPQIVRGRLYDPNKEPLCNERWQVSYNWRFQNRIPLGRFNQKGEPLFYGSLPTQLTIEDKFRGMDYVTSCAFECFKELSAEYVTTDIQDITMSAWVIEKPFYVVNLCFDDKHLADNPDLKESVGRYLSAIHTCFSKKAANFIEEFIKYFSELSRTVMNKDECYQVLAPLFIALRFYSENIKKEPIYGMIYPSAMTLAKGLNVVLTRDAVKQFLRLDKIMMYRYSLSKTKNDTWNGDKCSDIIKVKGRKFTITNYVPQ